MVSATPATSSASPWIGPRTHHDYRPGASLAEWSAGAPLQRGESGEAVQALQAQLNALGAQPPLEVDGLFGPLTEAALQSITGQRAIDGPTLRSFGPPTAAPGDGVGAGRRPTTPPVAPHVEAKAPPGTVKAGALQNADAERRRTNGSGMKSGAPPGYATITGAVPPGVVSQAKTLLHHDYGTEIPFEVDGQRYLARLERHYHPPGYQGGPNGWHKGVTVYRATT